MNSITTLQAQNIKANGGTLTCVNGEPSKNSTETQGACHKTTFLGISRDKSLLLSRLRGRSTPDDHKIRHAAVKK